MPPEASRAAHLVKWRASDGGSMRKMSSTWRRYQIWHSSSVASTSEPGWEARKDALMAPAETPAMMGKRRSGRSRERPRSTPA